MIYIQNKKWKEANAVFRNYCYNVDKGCGYAWRLLGMSYFKLRDMDNAEKCLEVSNVLDNQNADTWGMLSVICMIIGIGQNRGFLCYQNALKLGLNEPEIFSEIADLFSKTVNLVEESINCFERSLEGEPNQEDLWIKYAVYMLKQGDILKAIQNYKSSLQYIDGEVKKGEIQTKIDDLQHQLDTKESIIDF
jgi:tetratricopeptide (TPR) repeat protein